MTGHMQPALSAMKYSPACATAFRAFTVTLMMSWEQTISGSSTVPG